MDDQAHDQGLPDRAVQDRPLYSPGERPGQVQRGAAPADLGEGGGAEPYPGQRSSLTPLGHLAVWADEVPPGHGGAHPLNRDAVPRPSKEADQ